MEDAFDKGIFDIESVTREGDSVHVDMEIDIDRLVYQMLLRVLASRNSDLGKLGASINLGKRPVRRAIKKVIAKKAASRKKATTAKASAKKK